MKILSHIKIFISSTFKDMHDERQKLITNVFIKFRKLAKQRGVEVTEIELRTGVELTKKQPVIEHQKSLKLLQ